MRERLREISSNFIVVISSFLYWLRPTFEDNLGQASNRRLTAFVIVILYSSAHIRFFAETTSSYLKLYVLILDAVFVLMLFGLISAQNIIEFFRKHPKTKTNDDTGEKG